MVPFVTVCTPTYNRRPFIKMAIRCFLHQTYPLDRMEWIIVDDGTDKIGELVSDIKQVKYYALNEKLSLGAKRNFMNAKASGDFIVYMDDDDYYPPERVSHAIETLTNNPQIYCVGCSELHIYFNHNKQMYQFGPYGEHHATAATFAFRKTLLDTTSYDENACLAEEKHFLKNYTIPLIQLDPKKTILVFSHNHNTFDKKSMIGAPFVTESTLTLDNFIPENDHETRQFILNDIENMLACYLEGKVENKPDVIKQTEEMRLSRENREKELKRKNIEAIMKLNPLELANIYEKKMHNTVQQLNEARRELESEREKNKYLNNKITEIIAKSIAERQCASKS